MKRTSILRVALVTLTCIGMLVGIVPVASASNLITPNDPRFVEAMSEGLANADRVWQQMRPGEPSPFSQDFGMALHTRQPTSSPLQRTYDTVVALRLRNGVELHSGLTVIEGKVDTGLLIRGLLPLADYSMTSTVTQLTDGSLLTEARDSLGKRVQEVIAALPLAKSSNCSSNATCDLVGVGIGVGGAVACATLLPGGPLGFIAGVTCGLIAVTLGVGSGTVCQSLQPGCNFAAQISVTPICRDWYCTMAVLGVNNDSQPFRESHTILSWRNSNGTDAYIQGHIQTRHSIVQPSPEGVQIITQDFEISAPRDTVRCTTEVWMYTQGRWVGETAASPQVDVPKFNVLC